MARRNPTHPEYSTWDVDYDEHERTEYVGIIGEGEPVFYNPEERTLFRGEPHAEDERVTPLKGSERDLDPGETIGEAIERLGEKTGWDALSEFARKHLESDDEGEEN